MLKLRFLTNRTNAYGHQEDQVGCRTTYALFEELTKIDRMDEPIKCIELRLTTPNGVPNGHDDVLPEPDGKDHNDPPIKAIGIRKRDPIKGRSADLVIFDDAIAKEPVGVPAQAPVSESDPTVDVAAIDAEDYIQLDLT